MNVTKRSLKPSSEQKEKEIILMPMEIRLLLLCKDKQVMNKEKNLKKFNGDACADASIQGTQAHLLV